MQTSLTKVYLFFLVITDFFKKQWNQNSGGHKTALTYKKHKIKMSYNVCYVTQG